MSDQGWDEYLDPRPERMAAMRKRAHPKAPEPAGLPPGPCCGRCPNWSPPYRPKDPFGECAVVACTTRRVGTIEKGTLIPVEELEGSGVYAWEPMRVRDWAPACSRYAGRLFFEEAA